MTTTLCRGFPLVLQLHHASAAPCLSCTMPQLHHASRGEFVPMNLCQGRVLQDTGALVVIARAVQGGACGEGGYAPGGTAGGGDEEALR